MSDAVQGWRVGHRMNINVYDEAGNPVGQCQSEEYAAQIVAAVNQRAELLAENERLKEQLSSLEGACECAIKTAKRRGEERAALLRERDALREQKAAIGNAIYELHSMMVANPLQADDARTFSEALHELRVAAENWRAAHVKMLKALRGLTEADRSGRHLVNAREAGRAGISESDKLEEKKLDHV